MHLILVRKPTVSRQYYFNIYWEKHVLTQNLFTILHGSLISKYSKSFSISNHSHHASILATESHPSRLLYQDDPHIIHSLSPPLKLSELQWVPSWAGFRMWEDVLRGFWHCGDFNGDLLLLMGARRNCTTSFEEVCLLLWDFCLIMVVDILCCMEQFRLGVSIDRCVSNQNSHYYW